mmetsp:Transcript_8439/g.16900  ORF Transcript_8439/g.16900 Transcript_8439/m.16900 type:complete len:81 (-) Transcript_8439:1169-1411(-)
MKGKFYITSCQYTLRRHMCSTIYKYCSYTYQYKCKSKTGKEDGQQITWAFSCTETLGAENSSSASEYHSRFGPSSNQKLP